MNDNDIQKEFGRRVGVLRKRQGLTQDQLAGAISKSVDTVSNIERGFSSTRISTAASIASVLGVTLSDLFKAPGKTAGAKDRQLLIDRLIEITNTCNSTTLKAVVDIAEVVACVETNARTSEKGAK